MDSDKYPIYSLGHGTRNIEVFSSLLKEHDISYVVDVRTRPASRFNPQYNKAALSDFLKNNGMRYVYMGDSLGGRPSDTSCYDEEGRVDYAKVMEKKFFLDGIKRLETAYTQNLRIACFCSEISPCDCHRSKLIGVMLEKLNIPMVHINKTGQLENQETVINRVLGSNLGADLFNDQKMMLRSRKSYI